MQTWTIVGAWLLVAALALGAREAWRRPRLAVELSLRGSTRTGTLYVRVHNRGRRSARDVRVEAAWTTPEGEAIIAATTLGEIEGRGAGAWALRDLHRAGGGRTDWAALRVRASAGNAFRAEGRLDLSRRAQEEGGSDVPPVQYRREPRCPESPDGEHLWQTARFPNDGVIETWHVCARCRHLRRDPLTPEQEAAQARVRRERAERERRKLEEELDRTREEPRTRRPEREEPGDTMPAAVAFWVLGLDAERATWEDVAQAHRRLALEHHPDRAGPGQEQRMADVNRARDRLREHFGR